MKGQRREEIKQQECVTRLGEERKGGKVMGRPGEERRAGRVRDIIYGGKRNREEVMEGIGGDLWRQETEEE